MRNQWLLLFVWSEEWATLVLLLMLCKHGHKEICPASHAIAYQVKLLEASVRLFICPVVSTGHSDQVGPSLTLCGGKGSVRQRIPSSFSSMLTLANASMNSSRLSWGNDSGILMSTSQPLGMNLHYTKQYNYMWHIWHTSITCRKVVQIYSFNWWGKRNLAHGGWNSVIEHRSWV